MQVRTVFLSTLMAFNFSTIQQGTLAMIHAPKPPYILVKTWLDVYYSQKLPGHEEAQNVVKKKILKTFDSLYDAEMYLYKITH